MMMIKTKKIVLSLTRAYYYESQCSGIRWGCSILLLVSLY